MFRALYIFDMEHVKSPVADNAEVRVHDSEKAKAKRAWLHSEQKRDRDVELITFPRFVPAPSKDELIDLATAYNSSLGW